MCDANESSDGSEPMTTELDYTDLSDATGGFSDMCKIGGGGSCLVYRGDLFGTVVAIKAIDGSAEDRTKSNVQDWDGMQFKAEMDLLCSVRHPNICRLFATSSNGPKRCLVLEFMKGGSLDMRLGIPSTDASHPHFNWKQRRSVLLDVARGLVSKQRKGNAQLPMKTMRLTSPLPAGSLAHLANTHHSPRCEVCERAVERRSR
jgi:serine/threonine protein kinase